MNKFGPRASAIGVLLSFLLSGLLSVGLLPSCGGGSSSSGSGNGGDMFINTCSLGCSNGAGVTQVSCSIVSIALDREIDVFFSDAIDPASVNSTTFQLIDSLSGQAPVGTRFVDATDPTKMIFRPAITFDNQGNVTFGFSANTTYLITIPGTAHGDAGPFVRSVSGNNNQSRMGCQIHTTNQVDDLVAGPPLATVWVSLATGQPPPNDHLDNQPAAGATNVWHNSTIRFSFNDVMNPVSLVNPLTHQATLITIQVDSDGNPATTNDQVTLFGNYVLNIDLQHLTTDLIFTPANGIPSAGEQSLPPPHGSNSPRFLIINIPPGVQDLAGNGVSNPGPVICYPELIQYNPLSLPDADGENFTSLSNEDTQNSGADWGSGRLASGWGGGSGRLGSLHVPALQTLTLDSTGTLFKNLSAPDPTTSLPIVATTGILDNSRPTGAPAGYNPTDVVTWPTATVTDGVFEFSSVFVENGAILRFVGTKHVRLFSRGPVTINGVVDLSGESCAAQLSDALLGGVKGGGGPNGGDGGDGGDRPDTTDLDLQSVGGVSNPGAVVRGGRGLGVGRTGTLASGKGGINCPDPMPIGIFPTEPDRGGTLYSDIDGTGTALCTARQVASPGGGGGYGVSGGSAAPSTPTPLAFNPAYPPPPLNLPNLPSVIASGGDSAALGIEPPDPQSGHQIRLLDAQRNLRGGSGGGGGGANIYNTYTGVNTGPDGHACYNDATFGLITVYTDHSAAGGGGGGGAIQIASGVLIHIGGSVVAAGGSGGNSVNDPLNDRASRAAPGGGGSGGAVRLQARSLTIDPTPEHVDVSGGLGGVNLSPADDGGVTTLGHGGDGGSGLIRLEDLSGGTTPPATLMTRCSEAPKLLPFAGPGHTDPNTPGTDPCFGQTESEALLSVGAWSLPTRRPETFSSSVSCWMRPTGNFFTLDFAADDLTATPPVYGWNMNVLYHNASGADVITTYRGRDANTPFSSGDFESNFGSAVNYLNEANPPGNQFGTGLFDPGATGTYMTVRFQGALAISDISADPCDVLLSGTGSKIATGSLTPWVRHPSELNSFQPRPNMIRFCVVFDRSLAVAGTIPANVRGVTGLIISAQPD